MCSENEMPRSILTALVALVIGLTVLALILPPAASAWRLNLANVNIAHAAALPADSPNRFSALSDAETQLTSARDVVQLSRSALASARVFLLRGDSFSAVRVMSSASAALQNDGIAQSVWADAEWQLANQANAYDHWRAAGAIEFFLNEAQRALDRHDWQAAERLARIAVGIAPERADAHYTLGDALSHLALDDPAALREMERAAELTRDNELRSTILSRQGEVLAALGNSSAAFGLFDQAMQVAPLDARPRTDYARTLLQSQPDARDRAAELLKQSIAIAPWDTAAYATLAEIAESRGDVKSTEEWYRQGLARNVNDARLLFALGDFYARQNRLDEARTTVILALKYETRADDLQSIARALAELNRR